MHIIWIIWRMTDTFSCWSPVCLATGIVDAVWWESWACWLVPGGQSCCLGLASSSVLPSSSLLWSHFWYSLLSRFSSWMWHKITLSSFSPRIGFLPARWAPKPGQHLFSYKKMCLLDTGNSCSPCWDSKYTVNSQGSGKSLRLGRELLASRGQELLDAVSQYNSWSSFWLPKCAYFLLVMALVLMGWESAFGCRWRANCCPGVMWSLLPAGVSIP